MRQRPRSNAGKLVSTKLTRRRTNKMNTFPKDVAKCSGKIAKAAELRSAPSATTPPIGSTTIFPLVISPTGYQSAAVHRGRAGRRRRDADDRDRRDRLGTRSTASPWSSRYDLDGTPLGQLVLYGGETPTDYRVLLGALTAGEHTIGLHPEKTLSPNPKAPCHVTAAASVEAIPAGDSRYDFTRFAPILLGIDEDLNTVNTLDGPHRGNAAATSR